MEKLKAAGRYFVWEIRNYIGNQRYHLHKIKNRSN